MLRRYGRKVGGHTGVVTGYFSAVLMQEVVDGSGCRAIRVGDDGGGGGGTGVDVCTIAVCRM